MIPGDRANVGCACAGKPRCARWTRRGACAATIPIEAATTDSRAIFAVFFRTVCTAASSWRSINASFARGTAPGATHGRRSSTPCASLWTEDSSVTRFPPNGRASGHFARHEELLQSSDFHRLDEVRVEASLERACPVLRSTVTADGDQYHVAIAEFTTQRPCNLVSVHAGQSDVQQHEIRAIFPRNVHRFGACRRDADVVVHELQQRGKAGDRVGIIIDDENATTLEWR